MTRRFWLMKSDPEAFGWEDLKRASGRGTVWDGVLFYHSQSDKAVMGTAKVTRSGFPEPGTPPWFAVEIEVDAAFTTPVTLDAMRAVPALGGMVLLKRGSRLSIQPVSALEWAVVTKMGARP